MTATSVFEQIVEQVHLTLDDPTVSYACFRPAQHENAELRRVIWIPLSFETNGVSPSNARLRSDTGAPVDVLYQEDWSVECHIVGETFADAEDMRERIIGAVRRALKTSARPAGGTWANQGEGDAQLMFGAAQKVVQRFVWTVNVIDRPGVPQLRKPGVTPTGPEF